MPNIILAMCHVNYRILVINHGFLPQLEGGSYFQVFLERIYCVGRSEQFGIIVESGIFYYRL